MNKSYLYDAPVTAGELASRLEWCGMEASELAGQRTVDELIQIARDHPDARSIQSNWALWVNTSPEWVAVALKLGSDRGECLEQLQHMDGGSLIFFKETKHEFDRYRSVVCSGLARDGHAGVLAKMLELGLINKIDVSSALGEKPTFKEAYPFFSAGLINLDVIKQCALESESLNPVLRLTLVARPGDTLLRDWACDVITHKHGAQAAVAVACVDPSRAAWAWSLCRTMSDCEDALAMYRVANGETLLDQSTADAFARVVTLDMLTDLAKEKSDELTATILCYDYDVPNKVLVDALEGAGFFESVEDVLTDRHMNLISSKLSKGPSLS